MAYYSLPIPDIHPDHGGFADFHGYLIAFTRIIRLTLMGDFDMWSMEGVDDQITIPKEGHNKTVVPFDHGPTLEHLHHALRIWILFLSLLFPVVLLNVYVGLISSAYTDARRDIVAITGEFRVSACFRLLLHRRFWKNFPCGSTNPGGTLCSLDTFWRRVNAGCGTPPQKIKELTNSHVVCMRLQTSRAKKYVKDEDE